jgi:hypothetical protein
MRARFPDGQLCRADYHQREGQPQRMQRHTNLECHKQQWRRKLPQPPPQRQQQRDRAVVPAAKRARTAREPPAATVGDNQQMLSALVTSTTQERTQAFNAVHAVFHMHYYVKEQPVRGDSA